MKIKNIGAYVQARQAGLSPAKSRTLAYGEAMVVIDRPILETRRTHLGPVPRGKRRTIIVRP